MKRLLALLVSFTMVFSITGCDNSEDHIGEAKTPSGSSVQKGRSYQDVVEDFEEQGFTNIQLEELDDLVTGWLTKEGEVESVSVDGDEGYSADAWYPNDVAVVITYHVFPDDEPTSENEEQSVPSVNSESAQEVLTVDNCEEFAAILAITAEVDSAYASFAEKYSGRTIEFDGCITYLTNHDDYDTRYDILLSAGDYADADTANPGPVFKFENVAVYSLGISDLYLPDYVSVGSNVLIRAEVKSFDENTGVFKLNPVSITER